RPSPAQMAELVRADLEAGAAWVIIEGRETGQGVGVYREDASLDPALVEGLVAAAGGPERLLWEAPQKGQQQALIERFGPNVNLGNVPPGELLALEALRVGLRGDTLRPVVRATEPSPPAASPQLRRTRDSFYRPVTVPAAAPAPGPA